MGVRREETAEHAALARTLWCHLGSGVHRPPRRQTQGNFDAATAQVWGYLASHLLAGRERMSHTAR